MFKYAVYLSYIVYIAAMVGITILAPDYIETLEMGIKAYVGAFLLWRFRPPFIGGTANGQFTDHDRKVAFHAGVAVLVTSGVVGALMRST